MRTGSGQYQTTTRVGNGQSMTQGGSGQHLPHEIEMSSTYHAGRKYLHLPHGVEQVPTYTRGRSRWRCAVPAPNGVIMGCNSKRRKKKPASSIKEMGSTCQKNCSAYVQ